MNIHHFQSMKQSGKKISMMTCYDYTLASIINQSSIDCILVGDSAANVMHGYKTTIPATLEMMVLHTEAVVKGAPDTFIVGDLPFLSYRKSLDKSMQAVQALMQAGAQAIKLEGLAGNEALIKHIVDSGVPVMGHLGLTPQSVHQLGGFKYQGKTQSAAAHLLLQAKTLEGCGCFSVVLECVPSAVAKHITEQLRIPTIGIGAGSHTSGQVLVLHDALGMNPDFSPRFVKKYMEGFSLIHSALNQYDADVKAQAFPASEHDYSVPVDTVTEGV